MLHNKQVLSHMDTKEVKQVPADLIIQKNSICRYIRLFRIKGQGLTQKLAIAKLDFPIQRDHTGDIKCLPEARRRSIVEVPVCLMDVRTPRADGLNL